MDSARRAVESVRQSLHDLRPWVWVIVGITIAYASLEAIFSGWRVEHTIMLSALLLLVIGPRQTKGFARLAIPGVLVPIIEDILRQLSPRFLTVPRVHGCDVRALDIRLFGIGPDTALADFFAGHHTPFFDVFFAIPYAAFIYVPLVYGLFVFLRSPERTLLLAWSFVGIFLISSTIFLLIPTAPPWYVQTHGCAIDLAARGSAAGLARVDDLLGIRFFHVFYDNTPTVFGAMPSLHNAFPFIQLLVIWPIARWPERVANLGYVVWMISASVYLGHHWVLDGLGGWAIAAISVGVSTLVLRRRCGRPARAAALAAG